jgi:hypothetical protein
MKRYTGQQALYEAISRSRAKAKQGSVLEKLRAEHFKPENPAGTPSPQVEPQQVPEPSAESGVQTFSEPQVVETQPQPVVECEPQAEPRVETLSEPVAETVSHEPIVKARPVETALHLAPPSPVQTWLKPRPVQLNEGRIEISVPYHVGAIAGLVLLLVIVGAYRLGGSGSQPNAAASSVVGRSAAVNPPAGSMPRSATADAGRPTSNSAVVDAAKQDVVSTAVQGDHLLVLALSKRQEDFGPVVQHFRENEIEVTPVSLDSLRQWFVKSNLDASRLPSGDGFLLVTANLYGNPKVAGTDGFKMKQRITEVGARYKGKAPSGYNSFAPNYFSDAYGMKVR